MNAGWPLIFISRLTGTIVQCLDMVSHLSFFFFFAALAYKSSVLNSLIVL